MPSKESLAGRNMMHLPYRISALADSSNSAIIPPSTLRCVE